MLRRIAEILGILAPIAAEPTRLYELREHTLDDVDLSRMFARSDLVVYGLDLSRVGSDITAFAVRMPDGSMVVWRDGEPIPACVVNLIPTSAEAGVLPSHRKQS